MIYEEIDYLAAFYNKAYYEFVMGDLQRQVFQPVCNAVPELGTDVPTDWAHADDQR